MLYMIEMAQDMNGFIGGWYIYKDDINMDDTRRCIMDLIGSGVGTAHFRVYEKTSPNSIRLVSLYKILGTGITIGENHEHH